MKMYNKILLSGDDWLLTNALPDEVSPTSRYFKEILCNTADDFTFIPATVPGDVQSDAFDAGLIEDINIGFNALAAEWTSQRDWVYVKRFIAHSKSDGAKKIKLCFDGVDYACEVYINGKWIGDHENSWIPFSFDITGLINEEDENCLIVIVKSAPDGVCQFGKASQVRNLKARFAYGWDWCTRLVPLGIWKDVYLKYEYDVTIDNIYVHSVVDYNNYKACMFCECTLKGNFEEDTVLYVNFTAPNGNVYTKTIKIDAKTNCRTYTARYNIDNAILWYPNGYGEQPLYHVDVTLCNGNKIWDSMETNTGLRHIEWCQTKGASDDALPYQPIVNGRLVFIQGFNFVPIHQLYGREHFADYERRIELCKRSGANFLRVWGGGLCEREYFYDLCDKNGILVMQELFQSSGSINNHPPRDKEYIKMMQTTTKSVVLQKRNHVCLAVWCGGNELCFRGEYIDSHGNVLIEGAENMEGKSYDISNYRWIPLSADYPTLKAMGEVVAGLDPERLWLHTSGSGPYIQNASLDFVGGKMHDVHGPWHVLNPNYYYELYNKLDMMLHSEFGCNAPASVQALEYFVPPKYRFPLDEKNPMVQYHSRVWSGNFNALKPYFREISDYKAFSLAGRFIQWESLRYAIEAHKRLDRKCAGVILWHLAEAWPCVSDDCIVDFSNQPKPAYYGVKKAFEAIHISAKYNSIIHENGFDSEITIYNSTNKAFRGLAVAYIYDIKGKLLLEHKEEVYCKEESVVPRLFDISLKETPKGVFYLSLELFDDSGNIVDTNYSVHSTNAITPYKQLLNLPNCKVDISKHGDKIELRNVSEYVVPGLSIECSMKDNVYFSDGCIMLLPGEKRIITMKGEPLQLFVNGFGVPYHNLI